MFWWHRTPSASKALSIRSRRDGERTVVRSRIGRHEGGVAAMIAAAADLAANWTRGPVDRRWRRR
jgi:hypothetical protein